MSTRTFIAIELTPGARAALARRIEQLRRALPHVRWVKPARLHDTLARRLVERGLPADDTHAFSPHLTLARLKQRLPARDAERLSAAIAASQTSQTAHTTPQLSLLVEHIAVMKSDLLPSGARYTCLRSCPLGTASSGASAVSGE